MGFITSLLLFFEMNGDQGSLFHLRSRGNALLDRYGGGIIQVFTHDLNVQSCLLEQRVAFKFYLLLMDLYI